MEWDTAKHYQLLGGNAVQCQLMEELRVVICANCKHPISLI